VITAGRVAQRTRGVFYGWWIVSGGVGIQLLIAALLNQAYGAYVVTLQAHFGWSKTAFSAAYALQQAESGLLGPVQGWMIDRFGPRRVMRAGIVILGIGFMLFSQVNSLTTFYITFLVMAVGSSLGGFMSITTTIVNWFERKRGTALAIMQTGAAFGGLMVPLVAWSLTANGWRATAFGSGVLIILIGLPLSQLMRHKPEQYGQLPDGVSPGDIGARGGSAAFEPSAGFTPKQALRTRSFWFLSIAHSLAMFVVASISVHLVPHLTEDLNFSLAGAAGIVSVMTGAMMVGQLVGGVLGDRYDKRRIAVIATCGHVAAMVTFVFAAALPLVVLGAILQGSAHGVRGVQMMPIRADYFGRQSFATIMGFSSMVMMWGIMAGPIIIGQIADRRGEYNAGFWLLAAVAVVAVVLFAFSTKPNPPRTTNVATPH
jgi:MFS family permease